MEPQLTLEPASPSDLGQIRRLLDESKLPSADVGEHLGGFLVARLEGDIVGFVGVEPHGREALLRSLCVLVHNRGRGVGRSLCAGAEALARGAGARDLYLLTTDAQGYFERQGFVACRREDVAETIRRTGQFQTLCPSTATVMKKRLPAT